MKGGGTESGPLLTESGYNFQNLCTPDPNPILVINYVKLFVENIKTINQEANWLYFILIFHLTNTVKLTKLESQYFVLV